MKDLIKNIPEELCNYELQEATKIFWNSIKPSIKRTKVSFIDEEFPEAYGLDGYDFMAAARAKGWTPVAEVGDRPYVIILYKDDQLMEYCEGDIVYYNLIKDE